jgi:hypothetical protein
VARSPDLTWDMRARKSDREARFAHRGAGITLQAVAGR